MTFSPDPPRDAGLCRRRRRRNRRPGHRTGRLAHRTRACLCRLPPAGSSPDVLARNRHRPAVAASWPADRDREPAGRGRRDRHPADAGLRRRTATPSAPRSTARLTTAQRMMDSTGYDVSADIAPVTLIATSPLVLGRVHSGRDRRSRRVHRRRGSRARSHRLRLGRAGIGRASDAGAVRGRGGCYDAAHSLHQLCRGHDLHPRRRDRRRASWRPRRRFPSSRPGATMRDAWVHQSLDRALPRPHRGRPGTCRLNWPATPVLPDELPRRAVERLHRARGTPSGDHRGAQKHRDRRDPRRPRPLQLAPSDLSAGRRACARPAQAGRADRRHDTPMPGGVIDLVVTQAVT